MLHYQQTLKDLWEKSYRASQIDQAIYKDFVSSWDEITTLPNKLREQLKNSPLFPIKELEVKKSSIDWTIKVLFETHDKQKIESVMMRHHKGRNTVCVSCQIWCGQWCTFCATWNMWFKRNLTEDEIISQVLYFANLLKKENSVITNVVYMWMWEPFLNYDNVMKSVYMLHDQKKFWISARHITLSTSWVVPWIEKFSKEPLQLNLAISIHAWTDETRSKIMPVNLAYPLKDLINSLNRYQKVSNRKIFYEYVMLEWINDDISEAVSLSKLIKNIDSNRRDAINRVSMPGNVPISGNVSKAETPTPVDVSTNFENGASHINIIPFNAWAKEKYQCSSRNKMRQFQKVFLDYKIPSTIRVSLGQDIDGACGQLASD